MGKFWAWVCIISALGFPLPSSAGQLLEIWPGKSVEILGVGSMDFPEGPQALILRYQTTLPLTNIAELTKEVDAVWNKFVVDAENRGFRSAVVSANEPPVGDGPVTKSKVYNFVYQRGPQYWRQSGKRVQETIKSAREVEDFVDRLDHIFANQLWNALISVMADEWTFEGQDPSGRRQNTGPIDRVAFINIAQQAYGKFLIKRRRETISTTVAPDGLSATLESREVTEMISGVVDIKAVSRLSDMFEMRGERLFWRRSYSVIEEVVENRYK